MTKRILTILLLTVLAFATCPMQVPCPAHRDKGWKGYYTGHDGWMNNHQWAEYRCPAEGGHNFWVECPRN